MGNIIKCKKGLKSQIEFLRAIFNCFVTAYEVVPELIPKLGLFLIVREIKMIGKMNDFWIHYMGMIDDSENFYII